MASEAGHTAIQKAEIDGRHGVLLSRPVEVADRLHRYWTDRAGDPLRRLG